MTSFAFTLVCFDVCIPKWLYANIIFFYSEIFSIIYFRLYYDLSPDDPVLPKLCDLSCEANLDLCDIQRLPGNPMENATYMFPMNWRFLPTLDPQVNVYLSRDLDSEFNEREIAGNYLHFVGVPTLKKSSDLAA